MALALALIASGCSANGADAVSEATAVSATEILGGSKDAAHAAVQALIRLGRANSISGCTGTTIAVKGQSGILLTAAHCLIEVDETTGQPRQPMTQVPASELAIVPGDDWLASANQSQYFAAVQTWIHPEYDGETENPNDIALVRYVGATSTTPVIPILTAAEDDLAQNTDVVLVGYGRTGAGNFNTERYQVEQTIDQLSAEQIVYDQTNDRGACRGDSGGPALVATAGGERVAGVTSFGDQNCTWFGVSVRVSAFEKFVSDFIAEAPEPLACDDCRIAALAPGNPCHDNIKQCEQANSPCARFLSCLRPCQDQACATKCADTEPQGAEIYQQAMACSCTTCGATCAGDAACGALKCGGFGDDRAQCNTCMQGECCAQAEACAKDQDCVECASGPSSACTANAQYSAFMGCLKSCEGDPCGVSVRPTVPGAGGATGSGGDSGTAGSAAATMVEPLTSADSGNDDGGCSCSVPTSRSSASRNIGLAALFALSLALRRRSV